MACKYCNSTNMKERINGPHIEIYCGDCGKHQKFRSKKFGEVGNNMGFVIDHENASSGGLIPVGTYEAVIKAAFENTTPNEAMFINIPIIIRNDVEQPYRNAYVWHSIWRKKEPNKLDQACGGYNAAQINAIGKAAAIPNGKSYGSLDELFAELKGRPISVKIKHETYNDKTRAKVDFVDTAKVLPCKHVFKAEVEPVTAAQPVAFSEDIDDDDLPF